MEFRDLGPLVEVMLTDCMCWFELILRCVPRCSNIILKHMIQQIKKFSEAEKAPRQGSSWSIRIDTTSADILVSAEYVFDWITRYSRSIVPTFGQPSPSDGIDVSQNIHIV